MKRLFFVVAFFVAMIPAMSQNPVYGNAGRNFQADANMYYLLRGTDTLYRISKVLGYKFFTSVALTDDSIPLVTSVGTNKFLIYDSVTGKLQAIGESDLPGGGITDINLQNGTSQTLSAGTWMGIVSAANNHTYSVNTTLVRADVDSRVKDSTGYYTATVITSDATPTDMFFFAVPTGQLTTVIAQCNAIRTADAEGGYIGYKSNNLIKHAGGGISTSTVRSILADEYTSGASALSTATFTIQADGTTGGKITFTGEAGTGIKCQCRIQLNYVNAGL